MCTHLCIILLDVDLFLTDGAPELNGKLGNVLVLVLHAEDGEAEESLLHVESHVLVVEAHDTVETAKRALLYAGVFGLRSLADDLHDVIPLTLMLEVVADELEGVTKGGDGREAHFVVGLLLPGALNDSGQNGIGMSDQGGP